MLHINCHLKNKKIIVNFGFRRQIIKLELHQTTMGYFLGQKFCIKGKDIDIMICNDETRFAVLLSSKDLENCQKNFVSNFFVCKKRIIRLYNESPEYCSDNFQAKVLVFEKTAKKFIIERTAGLVQIVCDQKLFKKVRISFALKIAIG